MLVALPSSIAFGMATYTVLGNEHAGEGAMAGILGAAALGLVAPFVGRTRGLISAPCAPRRGRALGHHRRPGGEAMSGALAERRRHPRAPGPDRALSRPCSRSSTAPSAGVGSSSSSPTPWSAATSPAWACSSPSASCPSSSGFPRGTRLVAGALLARTSGGGRGSSSGWSRSSSWAGAPHHPEGARRDHRPPGGDRRLFRLGAVPPGAPGPGGQPARHRAHPAVRLLLWAPWSGRVDVPLHVSLGVPPPRPVPRPDPLGPAVHRHAEELRGARHR